MDERPEAEFYFNRSTRGCLVVLSSFLAVSFLGLFGFGGWKLAAKPPAEQKVAIVLFLFGGLGGVFWGGMALAWTRTGKLRFFADRAELPRAPAPPWCWLGPKRLAYSEVRRWGVTLYDPRGTGKPHTVLVFEVGSELAGFRIFKLSISFYPDPKDVLHEFQSRLRSPQPVEIGNYFGGVTFPE